MIHLARHSLNKATRFSMLAMGLWMALSLAAGAVWAFDDWQAPVMSDYVKTPPFITNAVKPNIMIILDNSGSMNFKAYASGYTGEPYAGIQSFTVASTQDDMEEDSTGVLRDGDDGANDLDMGTDYVGIRFQFVAIPKGVEIERAYIEFVAKGTSTAGSVSQLEIRGEAADNADHIDVNDPNNISSRAVTTASVNWEPDEFQDGDTVITEDITAIVQEIIDRAGWQENNAMLFRIAGINFPATTTGHRQVHASEAGETLGPVLRVHYGDSTATRYYGLFNPDYFYKMDSNTFKPQYKKHYYEYRNNRWRVDNNTILADTAIVSEGLWDGNWLNWLCMRRIDVLRKVLMGGKGTSRQGGGNNEKEGDKTTDSPLNRTFDTSGDGPAVSPYDGIYRYHIDGGDIVVQKPSGGWSWSDVATYKIDVQKLEANEPEDFFEGKTAGILQRIGDRARWGNMWFKEDPSSDPPSAPTVHGAKFSATIDQKPAASMATDLQGQTCGGYTPLAETYYMATQYFAQQEVESGLDLSDIPNSPSGNDDPYLDFYGTGQPIECAKSFVILLTDGASTYDAEIPSTLKNFDTSDTEETGCDEFDTSTTCDYDNRGTDFLDDVALYARTTDLRTDLDGDQNIILYTVYAFSDDDNARTLLKKAARNGGFEDMDNDHRPDGNFSDPPQVHSEWDQDGDGNPDTYFEASDGYALQRQLLDAINDIFKRVSSGTAASVISNSRSGEGAVFQSIFYPADGDSNGNSVEWIGQVQALILDSHGNLREDTNQNFKLDPADDMFVVYSDDPDYPVYKYYDDDGDGIFDPDELEKNGVDQVDEKAGIKDIKFLWSSQTWLNEISNTDITQQRTYTSTSSQRYIFTFADADNDMVPDSGEVQDFVATSDPSYADINSAANFKAYLYPYEPYTPPIDAKNQDGTDNQNFIDMSTRQVRRIVNYIRGQDQSTDSAGGVSLNAFRSRQMDYDEDGTVETWRLGDIIYSTPTVVGRPAENFDLIYRDEGYGEFYRKYRNRRSVVYVGANDGMLHAFNGGFFDSKDVEFVTQPESGTTAITKSDGSPYIAYPIGSELWAYVPHNLLPHLHWLTDPDYAHVCYVDLQPRIFDARIFESKNDPDKYPNGWGTVLVGGMRFGGGKIAADIDKSDGAYNASTDKAMSSAYYILDVTDPEDPPELLAEITLPNLGFTTCFPGVVPMRDFQQGNTEGDNQWYLFVGSGPIGDDPHHVNNDPQSPEFAAERVSLTDGTSSQQARLYAIDLKELVENNRLQMITKSAGPKLYDETKPNDDYYLAMLDETQSSISRPISIDWNLDFNTDVVYFGSSYGDHTSGWNGKMRRIVMDNDSSAGPNPLDPTTWIINSTMIEPKSKTGGNATGQPIMAPANAGIDASGNRWLFFGTGRYFSTRDASNTDQQSYYGIKEPFTTTSGQMEFNYTATVGRADLMDTTNITMIEGDLASIKTLANEIGGASYGGWVTNFDVQAAGERNLGQAVLAGDLLTFTTYMPSADVCSIGGESAVYALYYRTGTAYPVAMFGVDTNQEVLKRADLGVGMTISPNIHVGRETGSMAYIQTSTGAIKSLEEQNPGTVKSGKMEWMPDDQTCP